MGCGVLGVRLRMKGVFTTTNPLSRFFILWLGVAPNFSVFFASFGPQAVGRVSAQQLADRNANMKTENLVATNNLGILDRKCEFFCQKVR